MQDIGVRSKFLCGAGVTGDKGACFPEKNTGRGVWEKLVCKSWGRHRKQLNGPGRHSKWQLKILRYVLYIVIRFAVDC